MPRKKSAKNAKTVAKTVAKANKPVDATVDAIPAKPLLERWHDLAKLRLIAYVEIYRSGRWSLYYDSRDTFALRMVDVIESEKTWAALAGVAPAGDDDLRPAA